MKSETYHQDLPSTIGITLQVHTTTDSKDASLRHLIRERSSQDTVGTSTTSTAAPFYIADSCSTGDHCNGCVGITEVTGNRLYHHGIARSKTLAKRCARESYIKQNLHPILRKNMNEYNASNLESRANSTISKTQSVAAMQCFKRLYNLSKSKQDEGKMRREAIALASLKRNQVPIIDFGVLPADKAGEMYLRGVSRIEEREDYLEWRRAEIEEEIRKRHKFKLAEGAFALDPEAAFQARVYQSRYGKMIELDQKRRELVSKSHSNQAKTRDCPPSVISVGIGSEIRSDSGIGIGSGNEECTILNEIVTERVKINASQRRLNDQYAYCPRGLLVAKAEKLSHLLVDSNVAGTFTSTSM